MEDFGEKMLTVLIAVVLFFALIGVIIGQTTSLTWSALNIGGTIVNLSFVPYVLVLVIVIGVIILAYRYMLKKHK